MSSPDAQAQAPAQEIPTNIRARDLQARLERGDAIQLVDVREDAELELAQLGHPVVHLPLSRSSDWIANLPLLLDHDRPVAVLCHAGVRSWQLGCWLIQEHGYGAVWNLQGGIDAWSVEVDPGVPRY
jgi:rhodanese-related sulfurtransferase